MSMPVRAQVAQPTLNEALDQFEQCALPLETTCLSISRALILAALGAGSAKDTHLNPAETSNLNELIRQTLEDQ